MHWKTIILTVVMSLIMGGAALAQQDTGQSEGFLGIGGDDQQQMEQTFTGIIDQVEDDYLLIVGDRAYQLEVDDEEMVEGMIGQEVEVRGTLEEETIQAQSVNRAGEMQEQPGTQPYGTEQPMGGTETEPGTQPYSSEQPGTGTEPGAEQPMGGQEGNQTGWKSSPFITRQTEGG